MDYVFELLFEVAIDKIGYPETIGDLNDGSLNEFADFDGYYKETIEDWADKIAWAIYGCFDENNDKIYEEQERLRDLFYKMAYKEHKKEIIGG